MKFEFNNCVALQTNNPEQAQKFYEDIMGMNFDMEEDGSKYTKNGELLFFIDKESQIKGPVLDIFTEDIEKSKEHLINNGCKVLKWDDTGKYMIDPFGMCFNLSKK